MVRAERISRSLDETQALAGELAAALQPGDVVLLEGPLGAGKTTLVRGLAEHMGVDPRQVASPTFVIAHEHETPAGTRLVHIDAYRLSGSDREELELLGWDELAGPDAIVLIEWGDRVADLLPAEHATITIEHVDECSRRFIIEIPASWDSRPIFGRRTTRCPVTGEPVEPDAPHYPFSSERARWADLYRWFSESYTLERPAEEADLDQGQ